MAPEQKAAYILAQVALLSAEIAALQAENATRTGHLAGPLLDSREFDKVIERYKAVLDHNALITLFGDQ